MKTSAGATFNQCRVYKFGFDKCQLGTDECFLKSIKVYLRCEGIESAILKLQILTKRPGNWHVHEEWIDEMDNSSTNKSLFHFIIEVSTYTFKLVLTFLPFILFSSVIKGGWGEKQGRLYTANTIHCSPFIFWCYNQVVNVTFNSIHVL